MERVLLGISRVPLLHWYGKKGLCNFSIGATSPVLQQYRSASHESQTQGSRIQLLALITLLESSKKHAQAFSTFFYKSPTPNTNQKYLTAFMDEYFYEKVPYLSNLGQSVWSELTKCMFPCTAGQAGTSNNDTPTSWHITVYCVVRLKGSSKNSFFHHFAA